MFSHNPPCSRQKCKWWVRPMCMFLFVDVYNKAVQKISARISGAFSADNDGKNWTQHFLKMFYCTSILWIQFRSTNDTQVYVETDLLQQSPWQTLIPSVLQSALQDNTETGRGCLLFCEHLYCVGRLWSSTNFYWLFPLLTSLCVGQMSK